jgi:4-hydroxy-tetrahydrodipicolinate synthase
MKPMLAKGLWPVMISPMHTNGKLDYTGLEQLCHFYIQAGAAGLFANCLSSEMYQLSPTERLQLTKATVAFAQNKIPVIATGSFSKNIDKCADFVKKIYDCGVEAVVIVTNFLATATETEAVVKRNIEKIMAATGTIPLGTYECPLPYKRLLSAELLGWLAQSGRFLYHKDTSCNVAALQAKAKATKGTVLALFNADTTTAMASLEAGFQGLSPISANFYPELYSYLLKEYFANGRSQKLDNLQAVLTMMDRVSHSFYPYSAKLFLQRRGLSITAFSRIYCDALQNVDDLRLDALMETFAWLAESIKLDCNGYGRSGIGIERPV